MPEPGWRPDIYVVARFLERLAEPDRSFTRNQLQLAVRVNWDLLRKYLDYLAARGLVSVGEDRVILTKEGHEALASLRAWMQRVLGGDSPLKS